MQGESEGEEERGIIHEKFLTWGEKQKRGNYLYRERESKREGEREGVI